MSNRSAHRILTCVLLPSIVLAGCVAPQEDDDGDPSPAVPLVAMAMGSDWSSLGGTLTSAPVVVRDADNKLEVFVVGGNGALFHRRQVTWGGDYGAWSSLGGNLQPLTPAVGRNLDGRLQVFAAAKDGTLQTIAQTAAGGAWASSWTALGGSPALAPAVARNQDGRLEVFVVGADHAVTHRWQTAPNGNWSGWASLGGSATQAAAIGSELDGRLVLFIVDASGAVLKRSQLAPNSGWTSAWTSLGGTSAHAPVVARNQDGRLEIFIVADNGHISHRWQTSANGPWTDGWGLLGNSVTSQLPAVVRNHHGLLELIAVSSDGVPYGRMQTHAPEGSANLVLDDAWSDEISLGGYVTAAPTAVLDRYGSVEVLVRGGDNGLWHALTMSRFSQPDVQLQLRSPLGDCLDADAVSSVRSMLIDDFGDAYPDLDVVTKCQGGVSTIGAYTNTVPSTYAARVAQVRQAVLGPADLLGGASDAIGFHMTPSFVVDYARTLMHLPARIDSGGASDADGPVELDSLDYGAAGWTTVVTTLTGVVHAPLDTPDFTMVYTDTIGIDDHDWPGCTSSAHVEIGDPAWALNLIPWIGIALYTIEYFKLESHEGTRDGGLGGLGCRLASSLPHQILIALPQGLEHDKLRLRYDHFTVSAQGFLASAALELVPRAPSVSLEGPKVILGTQGVFDVSGWTDLRAPVTVTWTAQGGVVQSPHALTTTISSFQGQGDHTISVKAVDADGITVTSSMAVNVEHAGPAIQQR
jgi:hypothetical protein